MSVVCDFWCYFFQDNKIYEERLIVMFSCLAFRTDTGVVQAKPCDQRQGWSNLHWVDFRITLKKKKMISLHEIQKIISVHKIQHNTLSTHVLYRHTSKHIIHTQIHYVQSLIQVRGGHRVWERIPFHPFLDDWCLGRYNAKRAKC